nr:hypothetical protein [Clostridioides difficile]
MVNTKKIINLGNNINLTLIKTEKFKSNLISLYVSEDYWMKKKLQKML